MTYKKQKYHMTFDESFFSLEISNLPYKSIEFLFNKIISIISAIFKLNLSKRLKCGWYSKFKKN